MEFIHEKQINQLYNTSGISNKYDKVNASHTSKDNTYLSRVFTLCPHLQKLRLQSQCGSSEVLAVQVVPSISNIAPIPIPTCHQNIYE